MRSAIGIGIALMNQHVVGGVAGPPPALAWDAQTQGSVAGNTVLTVAHTVVANSGYTLLRVVVGWCDPSALLFDPQVVTVKYNGVTMTFLPNSQIADSGSRQQATYYLLNPAVGTHNVVVTMTDTLNIAVDVDSWDGVKQATPFGTATKINGSGTTAAATAVTVAAGNYALATLTIFGGTATTNGTRQGNLTGLGEVIFGASPNRMRLNSAFNAIDSGSVAPTWVLGAIKPWTVVAVELKAA